MNFQIQIQFVRRQHFLCASSAVIETIFEQSHLVGINYAKISGKDMILYAKQYVVVSKMRYIYKYYNKPYVHFNIANTIETVKYAKNLLLHAYHSKTIKRTPQVLKTYFHSLAHVVLSIPL